ncbi:MAG: hypothetical protein ABEJ23_09435 [Haloarculaceae archaeon]
MPGSDESASGRGFEILSDETRIGILRVLAERLRESPSARTLGFADLRRRVGLRDSGNFNYHLEKLVGRFVTKTDEGYRLSPAGVEVVAALSTGVYGEATARGPTDLGDPCPACGDALAATYDTGLLRVHCPNDHVFHNALPPGAVEGRSMADVVALLTRKTRRDLGLAAEHVCPFCYARLDWSADLADATCRRSRPSVRAVAS